MNTTDAGVAHIRAGKLIAVQEKTTCWLLGSSKQFAAFEAAISNANLPYEEAFLLIGEMNQLYDYVMRFSELAWDIAEGTEKALLIWYDNAKEVPAQLKDSTGAVPVMLNRCKTLQPLLQKLGHGVICLPLPSGAEGWQALPDVLPLSLDTSCKLRPETIMRLGLQGDIKFLKH